jgi:hypothetical protein
MDLAIIVVWLWAAGAVLLGWIYFRRFAVTRPPIGVVNLSDVALIVVGIVVFPYLYLALPPWLGATLLGGSILSALYLVAEPVLRKRAIVWLAALGLIVVDVWTAMALGSMHPWFLAANDLVLVFGVVGIANLWAQSGLKARDATLLAGFLAVYDPIATSQLTLTNDLISHLASAPFAPLIAWPLVNGNGLAGIGLGDLLLATVFPLVMRKAFGGSAGLLALFVSLAVVAGLFAYVELAATTVAIPVMAVLGPLMALQYVFWRRRGVERRTWQYLAEEPLRSRRVVSSPFSPQWEKGAGG